MTETCNKTTRETEQQRLGAFFALGGFPRVPPHDEPMACREAWLRGYDEAKTTPATPCACCGEPATHRSAADELERLLAENDYFRRLLNLHPTKPLDEQGISILRNAPKVIGPA